MGLFVPHSHHGPQKLSVHVQATNVVSDYDEKTTATTSLAALSPLKGKQQQRQRCCIYKKKPNNKIKKKKKQTKRVLFAAAQETDTNTDTTTNIATTDLTIDYYANATLSQSELKNPTIKKKLWWTKQDRLQSTKESLVLLRAFKVKNVQDIENYHQIYKTSILMYSSPSQIVSDSLENVTVSIPLSIRGLEWGLSSSFGSGSPKSKVGGGKVGGGGGGGMSSVKSRRKQHIENILAVQKHIKDQEIRQRFISSRSLQSSRPSRIMARMIGEGDALKSFSNQLQTTNTTTTTDNNNNSSGITTDSSLSTSSSSAAATTTTKNNLKQQQQKKGMETSTSSRHTTSTTRRATTKVTSTKKIGHVRKRRRQLLWRK